MDLQASGLLVPRTAFPDFPVSDNSFMLASTHLIATLIVQIIALLVFSGRVYTRAFPVWRFTLDDYIISVAFALMTIAFSFWFASNFWAWGGHNPHFRDIDSRIYSAKIGSLALPFWAWSTGLVKISIGIMLLRFQQSKRWKIVIYVMIALSVCFIILLGIVHMFQCIPYASLWDMKGEIKNKKCWGSEVNYMTLYSSSVCNVLPDIVFSLMPLTFLNKIRRPLGEKMVVAGLMALGLIASTFSLSKSIVVGKLEKADDPSAFFLLIGLLSCLEVQTSLIAACAPTLRSASKRFLTRIGLSKSEGSAQPPYAAQIVEVVEGKREKTGELRLGRVRSGESTAQCLGRDDSGDEEALYEADPVTGRIICTTELRVHSSHSHLNREWKANEGSVKEDEWRGLKGIGVAK